MEKKYFFDASDSGFYVFPDSTHIPEGVNEISFEDYSTFAGIA